MPEDQTSSLLRGVRALIGLAEIGETVSFGVLADALQLPPSTAHRILSTLRQAGYVLQDPATGGYLPGPAFLRAATTFCNATTFPHAVREALHQLRSISGESTYFGAYLAEVRRMRFLANVYSDHAVQYVPQQEKLYSVLWGASGRSIAAFLPRKTLQAIHRRERDQGEGKEHLTGWAEFEEEMAAIRHQGYCATSDHRFDGAHSVAAPVIGAEGFVIGCLGIGMPTLRQDDGRLPELSGLVIDAAARLSAIAQSMLAHPVLREPGPDGSPSR